jgi:hypothetical protein
MQTSKISRQISPLSNDQPQEGVTTYDRLSQAQGGIVFAGQVLTDPHRRVRRGPRTFEERVIDARHPSLDAALAESAMLRSDISRKVECGIYHSAVHMMAFAKKWEATMTQKDDDDKDAIRRGISELEAANLISRRMAANVREWLEA